MQLAWRSHLMSSQRGLQSDADPAQPFDESPAWKSRPAGRTPHRMSPHHQAEKNGSTACDGGWKLRHWKVDDLFNDALVDVLV